MKKKSLRILSLIVAIVMVVAMLPLSALAEETKKTRQVGVAVYGSEFTSLLTSAENMSLDEFMDTAMDVATKIADGEGVKVPEVDIKIIDENGKETKLTETSDVNVLLQTAQVEIPFQDIVKDLQDKVEKDIEDLKAELAESDLTKDLVTTVDDVLSGMTDATDKAAGLINTITANFAALGQLNPTLYRTYVSEEVPEGEYTVRVEGFYDSDENGNAITRDGYVLINDGLTDLGYGSALAKEFKTTVIGLAEEDKNNYNRIQFVGPTKGITGEIPGITALQPLYKAAQDGLKTMGDVLNNARDTINKWIKTLDGMTSWIPGSSIAANLREKILAKVPGYDFIMAWQVPQLTGDLKSTYALEFPGLWTKEVNAGFSFKNVDVAETGLQGSNFLLVNRDETVEMLKVMVDLGKEAFSAALKATFGYTDEESGEKYEGTVKLLAQLIKSEDGQLSLDYDVAYDIIKTYVGVIMGLDYSGKLLDTSGLLPKLAHPIPGMLLATSDENGIVKFDKTNNKTLTWVIDIVNAIVDRLGDSLRGKNEVVDMLLDLVEYVKKPAVVAADDFMNTLVYPFAQRMGLVGKKMASGNYIMFQIKTADDYWVNPLAYTMILTWENDIWLYVTVADLGLIMPYFAAGFYDFVRNTTFAGTIDKFINGIAGKDVNIITGILDPEGIDITKEMGKVVTGALTAFVGQIGFESLGLDTIFSTKSEFVAGLNKYLYENGRTAQNLMIYVNKQAMRAKSVYAGYVTEDWYFYNIDKSPTTTATKLIDKSTKDLAAAFVNPTKSTIITKTGNTVKSIVGSIGYKVEEVAQNIRTQIKSTIGAAVQSVVQKAFDSVKTSVTNFVKDMFSRLING